MGISKFKKEHNKAIEHMKSPEFKGFTTSFEEGKEEVTEIRARKLSPLGWELVWRYRLKELEDREQKWKKQNKQIKSLKHQLAEKDQEIERLKKIAGVNNLSYLLEREQEVRHQVCEKITNYLMDVTNPHWRYFKDGNQYVTGDDLLDSLKEIKNQIEQGESDGTRNSKNV